MPHLGYLLCYLQLLGLLCGLLLHRSLLWRVQGPRNSGMHARTSCSCWGSCR
jgi:hypothetical protein